MPRGNNKIVHSNIRSGDQGGRSYEDINKEIYWLCIIMATLIAVLILLALCYIAYEKISEYLKSQRDNRMATEI